MWFAVSNSGISSSTGNNCSMALREDLGYLKIGVGITIFVGGGVAAIRYAKSLRDRENASEETIKKLTLEIKELKKEIEKLNGRLPRAIEDVKAELANLRILLSERRSARSQSNLSIYSYKTASSENDFDGDEEVDRLQIRSPIDVDSALQNQNSAISNEEKKRALYAKVDALNGGSDEDKETAMRILQDNEINYKDDWEFLWRLGRSHVSAHEMRKLVEEKKTHALAAHEYTKQALDIYEASSDVNKWYAISLGTMNDYVSTKDKIQNGHLLKQHVERALELSPNEPTLHFMMGRWCLGVYMLTWIERKLAATLFATPPTSTVQDALDAFMKAEDLQPGFYKANQLFIARCYYEMSQYANAKKWLESAKALPINNQDDQSSHDEVLQLLAKL